MHTAPRSSARSIGASLEKQPVWRASLIFNFPSFLGTEPMIQIELGAFQTEEDALRFGESASFELRVQTLHSELRAELSITLDGRHQVVDLKSAEIFTVEVVRSEERTFYRSKRSSLDMLVYLTTQSSAYLHAAGAVLVELYSHQLPGQALISSNRAPGSRRSS